MNVVVTGGGTRAYLDDVRFLANVSTGRFSAEITEAFLRRGDSVWHVHAPSAALPFRHRAEFRPEAPDVEAEIARLRSLHDEWASSRRRYHPVAIGTGTVAEYAETLRGVLTENPVDVAILAMAVSDYEPETTIGKIRSDLEEWDLRLRRTPKVIRSVRDWAPDVFLVGFKLLSGASRDDLIATAREAREVNRADLVVANDLRLKQEGRHSVHILGREGFIETIGPDGPVADRLVDRIAGEFASRTAKAGR